MENLPSLKIIVVDDDPDDHFLTRKAIKSVDPALIVDHIYSGSQLMEVLFKDGSPRALNELPDVVFLDLNMPKIDGYRVLSEMNKFPVFRSVAVYILSSSPYEKDYLKWKEMGVSDFFVKPYEFKKLKEIFEDVISRHATASPNAAK